MKRCPCVLALLLTAAVCTAWIDYGEAVQRRQPEFGKAFQGFSLRLESEAVEFEQDSGARFSVHLRNDGETAPVPSPASPGALALLVILVDKDGASLVSQNLLPEAPAAPIQAAGGAVSKVLDFAFDDLRVAPFKEFQSGLPRVDEGVRRLPAGGLVPKVYLLRAILYSAAPGKRPGFLVASEPWPILLRPKSGARMTAAERQEKLEAWLKRLGTGAYGGMAVSSQLAALGEDAVDRLMAVADRGDAGDATVRESRIWAIVTLCNTGSPKAEAYILRRLHDPVDFGDLAFLAWHSQGFRSDRVTAALLRFAEDAACGRPMPWEGRHGPESRRHGRGALEFAFKHFASRGISPSNATVAGLVRLGDPKLTAFGIAAWKPDSAKTAVDTLLPLFAASVHGNLKRAVLACLAGAAGAEGFPRHDRASDANPQWLDACLWLRQRQHLGAADLTVPLRWLVLDVPREDTGTQTRLIAALAPVAGTEFPVQGGQPRLPDDWVSTWRWALQTSGLPIPEAIAFCTRMMRTRDTLPDPVRLGLLLELKRLIGASFPLPANPGFPIEDAW